MTFHDLPAVNASLNGLAGLLLLAGYVLVRSGRHEAHRRCMTGVSVFSEAVRLSFLQDVSAKAAKV